MKPILYEGTKRLYAVPMSRGQYNAYRKWAIPLNENPEDPGYLVEYVDGGTPNDPRHNGYISWSPKDVFERTYKPVLPDFQLRVIAEKAEVDERIDRLGKFLEHGTPVADDERKRMNDQLSVMRMLSEILGQRIAAFMAAVPDAVAPPAPAVPAPPAPPVPEIPWVVIDDDNPVTLPAADEWLVTVETDSGREVHVLEHKGAGKWRHDGEYTFQHGYYFHPIAWAPRPEPFAGAIVKADPQL